MTDVPIPLILDLWSLGHSASDVAERTGISRKHVTLIVHQARRIGDARATLHCGKNGRLLGRPGRRGATSEFMDAAPLISKAKPGPPRKVWGKPLCTRGHERIPANLGSQGHCLQCRREKRWAKEAK